MKTLSGALVFLSILVVIVLILEFVIFCYIINVGIEISRLEDKVDRTNDKITQLDKNDNERE